MEIYLVRHTTPAIEKSICYGQLDVDVDHKSFKSELKEIRKQIPSLPVKIYSSPLKRCLQLASSLGVEVQQDERLMELDFGKWENKKWSEIDENELNSWMVDFVNTRAGRGESYYQLNDRMKNFIQELLTHDHKTAIIVTHAGNIRSILGQVLGLPLENTFRLHVNYGGVLHLTISKNPTENMLHLK
jgi:alpha-ribazole phosphatase